MTEPTIKLNYPIINLIVWICVNSQQNLILTDCQLVRNLIGKKYIYR